MFFRKKENQLIEKAEQGTLAQSPFRQLWRRFRQRRLARWSMWVLWGLIFFAVFGDFIANERPLYAKLDGEHHFPVLKQYAVDLGLTQWEAKFFQKDWSEHDYEAAIFPPIPYSASTIDSRNSNYKSPAGEQRLKSTRWRHWLGTDLIGHDVAAGMIAGCRTALLVGLVAMMVATFFGVLFGALAGYFGDEGLRISRIGLLLGVVGLFLGWFYGFQSRGYAWSQAVEGGSAVWEFVKSLLIVSVALVVAKALAFPLKKIPAFGKKIALPLDLLVMRLIEVLRSIPGFLLLLSIVGILQSTSILAVMAVIGLIRWTGIARFLRAELLRVRSLGYVEAARAMGFSDWRILWKHALPNSLTPVLITISFGIASAVLLESTLSFLGLGVGQDGITWGSLLSEARRYPGAWWLAIFPGGAIFVTVTIFNLIGEGLSDAMGE